jgi:hypothetical protein
MKPFNEYLKEKKETVERWNSMLGDVEPMALEVKTDEEYKKQWVREWWEEKYDWVENVFGKNIRFLFIGMSVMISAVCWLTVGIISATIWISKLTIDVCLIPYKAIKCILTTSTKGAEVTNDNEQ